MLQEMLFGAEEECGLMDEAAKIVYRDTALTYSAGSEPRYRWNLEEDGGEVRLITYYTNKAREMYDKFV